MHGHVPVSFLEPVVLLDVVQVIPPYYDGSLHLHFHHNASQDTATNADLSSKWALFVDIRAIVGLENEHFDKSGMTALVLFYYRHQHKEHYDGIKQC